MERVPKQGEFYRHFKNKLYQITALAEHSETGEAYVVYQALYGDFKTYIRPLSMFASEVDHEKYPEVSQKYRFERITFAAGEGEKRQETDGEGTPNPWLLSFIEADSFDKRLEALRCMKGNVGQEEIDSICLIMDIPQGSGDIDRQLSDIRKHLETRNRYDGSRLR